MHCVRSHGAPLFLINHCCGCCNCRCHCYCLSATIRERRCPLVLAVLARAPLRPTGKHKLDLLLYFIFLFHLLLYDLDNASPITCPSRTLALAVVSSGTVQVVPPGILSGTFQYRLLGVRRKTGTSSSDICKFPVLLSETLEETMRGNWYPNTNQHLTPQTWSPPSLLRPACSEMPATCCRTFTTCLVASSVSTLANSCTIFCSVRRPSAKSCPAPSAPAPPVAWCMFFCSRQLHIAPFRNLCITFTVARTCERSIENRQMVTLDL